MHICTREMGVAFHGAHVGHQGIPDNNAHGANMGPIWGWQDPGGSHVGPMNFAIWDAALHN